MSTQLPTTELPRPIDVVGLPIRPVDAIGLVEAIIHHARARVPLLGCYANAHTVNLAWADPWYFRVLAGADVLFADGASVVWASSLCPTRLPERITAMDYFPSLARRCAEEGISVFLLGCRRGVAEKAAAWLETQHAALRIAGVHHGHFALSESHRVIDAINAARPDILAVGMSSPRQELWLSEHAARLEVPVRWCVGALFDYLAGRERRAPHWLRRAGGEWSFRLAMDPAGKWRRYLLGNPLFVWNVLRWRLNHRLGRRIGPSLAAADA